MPRGSSDKLGTIFGRPAPKNLRGLKNCPKFIAIFDNFRLWSRISPEWILISKIGKVVYQLQPIPRWLKKKTVNFGPQTKKLLRVMYIDHNVLFSGDYISALKGCCALKFLHALDIDQALVAHTQRRTGIPPKNFNIENLKFGLKFSVLPSITSGLLEVSSQNFFQSTCRKAGLINWVQFLEGPPPKICEG